MMTFWDHLEALRKDLIRIVVAVLVMGVAAFVLRDPLFRLVLWPTHADFCLWQWIGAEPFSIQLMNTGLAEQMMIHLRVAALMGLLVASPYVLYVLFGFVSPALYEHERRYSVRLLTAAYLCFMTGIVVNYLLVFPLTVRFLGTYQVSAEVANMLTISSYIDTLVMMTMLFGLVFELPVLCWMLGRFGLLRSEWMARYRRHAIVAILVVAALITPTTDIFTLLIVSLPIWLLYEVSILIIKHPQAPSERLRLEGDGPGKP